MTGRHGFGLIGHAREMALASQCRITNFIEKHAILPGALECIRSVSAGRPEGEPRVRRMRWV